MAPRLTAFGLRAVTRRQRCRAGSGPTLRACTARCILKAERQLHLPVDGEQHHGGHHRRVRLHDQGRRRRPVDDDADDQPCRTPRLLRRRTTTSRSTRPRSTRRSPASDLAAGTITGSLGTTSPLETDATNQLNGSGGFGTLTYALVSGGNAATAGTFGTIQVNADGSYVYTLTSPFDTSPDANNGANTEAAESFTYTGDRRQRQHRDRHDHGQHRRRRADGDVGQRQCERRRAADGCGVRGAVERRCRRGWRHD